MTKTIGIIGAGFIGSGVAQLAIEAGYNVVISNSRGPETLKDLITKLGPNAKASTSKEIADDKDIETIVLSIQLKNVPPLFKELNLKNKLIFDTSNYYPDRDGNIEVLDSRKITTSQYIVDLLDPSNKVVKTFNNIDAFHLISSATKDVSKQTTLPIAGDDPEAKTGATEFINNLGFQVIDAGSFKDSGKIEPATPFYVLPYVPDIPKDLSLDEQKKIFFETNAESITHEIAQKLINQAKNEGRVGGFISDFGETIVSIFTN